MLNVYVWADSFVFTDTEDGDNQKCPVCFRGLTPESQACGACLGWCHDACAPLVPRGPHRYDTLCLNCARTD